jgi:hypothetical protein
MNWKDMEGSDFEKLFHEFPIGTEENHEKLQSG